MSSVDRLTAYRCERCTRLTLRWAVEGPPVVCSYPTCRSQSLTYFPLNRSEENR